MQRQTVLITRSTEETATLQNFCSTHGIRLISQSFIRFEPVRASIPENIQVLFFGSKRAVDFFLLQSPIPETCKIACIGSATRKYLEALDYTVHFSGTRAGDPDEVAQELKTWLGNRTLHVALTEQSNRSMAKALPANQVVEIIVYKTLPDPVRLSGTPTVIVFTSPSNVEGFLVHHVIGENTQVAAWGKTTEKALNSRNIPVSVVLENSSEQEVIDWLKENC